MERIGIILAICFTFVHAQICSDSNGDPCHLDNNEQIRYLETRHPSIRPASIDYNVNAHCDLFATNGNTWYRSNYYMTSSCPEIESCGSIGPIWMNGSIPAEDDGIVDRVGCLRSFDSCCSHQYGLRMKNCNYYTVFCFLELPSSCPQRYCFDTDLSKFSTTNKPTTVETTTIITATNVVKDATEDSFKAPFICMVVLVGIFGVVILAMAVFLHKAKRSNLFIQPNLKHAPNPNDQWNSEYVGAKHIQEIMKKGNNCVY